MPRKYKVRIARSAEKDIESIYNYIAVDNPDAAVAFVIELEHQISTLETFPYRCPIIPEATDLGVDYRHLLYRDYRTIFRVSGKTVFISRVIHGSRLLDLSWLE